MCSAIVMVMTVTSELRNQAIHTAAVVDPELMTGAQAAAAAEDLAMASNAVRAARSPMAG